MHIPDHLRRYGCLYSILMLVAYVPIRYALIDPYVAGFGNCKGVALYRNISIADGFGTVLWIGSCGLLTFQSSDMDSRWKAFGVALSSLLVLLLSTVRVVELTFGQNLHRCIGTYQSTGLYLGLPILGFVVGALASMLIGVAKARSVNGAVWLGIASDRWK